MNRSELVGASLQPDTGSYQRSVEDTVSESTVQIIKNQQEPTVLAASVEINSNPEIETRSELSTLNGPSDLLIVEGASVVELVSTYISTKHRPDIGIFSKTVEDIVDQHLHLQYPELTNALEDLNNVAETVVTEHQYDQKQTSEEDMDDIIFTDLPKLSTDVHQEFIIQEGSSGPSFGEPLDQKTAAVEEANYMGTEITEIMENSVNSVEEITVYEVVTEYRPMPYVGQIIRNYPHIFTTLCDGEIINAESGERIIGLTQFIVNNGLEEPPRLDTESIKSQISPRSLRIDSDYVLSVQ